MQPTWIDTHCHLDAPEFSGRISAVINAAISKNVQALLVPTVRASDCLSVKELVNQIGTQMPGLVYTLGIHPIYINQAKESDVDIVEQHIIQSLSDPRFVGIGEIGLDYFVEDLDPLQNNPILSHQSQQNADQIKIE